MRHSNLSGESVGPRAGRRLRLLAPLAGWVATLGLTRGISRAQYPPDAQDSHPPLGKPDETRLPNGKKQSDEILKEEYRKSLADARELSGLVKTLQEEMERDDRFVLSLATLKRLDDIEKLTRRIRTRLKHY